MSPFEEVYVAVADDQCKGLDTAIPKQTIIYKKRGPVPLAVLAVGAALGGEAPC